MTPAVLLPCASAVPLLWALAAWLPLGRRALPVLAPFALGPALAALALLPDDAAFTLLKGHLVVSWRLDAVSRPVLLFTAFGWLLASVYGVAYLRGDPRRTGFLVVFLVAMSGNLLLVLAADAVTFYTGFAIMSFASWGLVVFEANPEAFSAGRVYLALVVLGELMVFPGLVKGAVLANSTALADIQRHWDASPASGFALWLLFFGFGIKAGIAPFHFWLPVAHPAAPTPASAVLSGCMIKAGLLGWIRLLPIDGPFLYDLAVVAGIVGAVNLVGGGLLGLVQVHPKAVLAYSSIQATGVLLLFWVPALITPGVRPVSIAAMLGYATFHSLHKVSLFLAAGVFPGMARQQTRWAPWLWLLLGVLALSYAGVPGGAADVAKSAAKSLFTAVPSLHFVPALLAVGGFLTLLLTARFVVVLRPHDRHAQPHPLTVATWSVASLIAVAYPFAIGHAAFSLRSDPLTWTAFGTAVYLLACWSLRRWPLRWQIPAGDLLHLPGRCLEPRRRLPGGRLAMAIESTLAGPAGAITTLLVILILVGLLARNA